MPVFALRRMANHQHLEVNGFLLGRYEDRHEVQGKLGV